MAERVHRFLGRLLQTALFAAVVALATFVSLGRVGLELLPQFQNEIVRYFNKTLPFALDIQVLNGTLQGFSPVLVAKDVRVVDRQSGAELLTSSQFMFKVDAWASILALEPRFSEAVILDPAITVAIGAGGELRGPKINVERFSRNFSLISIVDGRVHLVAANGEKLTGIWQLDLRRLANKRQIVGALNIPTILDLQIQGEGAGNPFRPEQFAGSLNGDVTIERLGGLAPFLPIPVNGQMKTSFWYEAVGDSRSLATSTDAHALQLTTDGRDIHFTAISADTELAYTPAGWQLVLQDLRATVEDAEFALPRAILKGLGQAGEMTTANVAVDTLNDVLVGSAVFPDRLSRILDGLSPEGELDYLHVAFEDWQRPLETWTAQTQVVDGTVSPFLRVPGLQGIDAFLVGSPEGAAAWIDTYDFSLTLDERVYPAPLSFNRVVGPLRAHWQHDMLFLTHGDFEVESSDHVALAKFAMDIPLKRPAQQPLAMYLDVGFRDVDAMLAHRYIPETIPAPLSQWIRGSVKMGHVTEGLFSWRGQLLNLAERNHTMQLALNIEGAELQFHPDWPPISDFVGQVLVDDTRVSVWSEEARSAGAFIDFASIELARIGDAMPMNAQVHSHTGVATGLDYLGQTPLKASVNAVLDDVAGAGSLDFQLGLTLDVLSLDEPIGVDLAMQFTGGTLYSEGLDLAMESINGELRYATDRGFFSNSLDATLFGKPIAIQIDSSQVRGGAGALFAGRFDVELDATDLSDWLDIPLPVEGRTGLGATLLINEASVLKLSSHLEGVELALPAPYGKVATQSAPLDIVIPLSGGRTVDILWLNRFAARLGWDRRHITGGLIDVTPRATFQLPDSVAPGAWLLTGRLPYVDVAAWRDTLERLTQERPQPDTFPTITLNDVSIDRMEYQGLLVSDLTLRGTLRKDDIHIDAWSPPLHLSWHQSAGSDALVTIHRADVTYWQDSLRQRFANAQELKFGENSGPEPVFPDAFGPIRIVASNLLYDETPLGSLAFTVQGGTDGMRITDLAGVLNGLTFTPETAMHWHYGAAGDSVTTVNLTGDFSDIRDSFKRLGLPEPFASQRGRVNMQLQWQGGPQDYAMESLNGSVDVSLKKGAFLPLPSGASGVLRIISLFNLADLLGKANIGQIFETGLSFDSAGGEMLFDGGTITIPGFKVDTSGGRFLLSSQIALPAETIEGELVVTLPVAANIPWVAALIGGLPVAAGAYLLSQVFEDQVANLSSAVYSISGQLTDPKVKFERVFEAKPKDVKSDRAPGAPPVNER